MQHMWLVSKEKSASGRVAVNSVILALAMLELSLLLAYKCIQTFNQGNWSVAYLWIELSVYPRPLVMGRMWILVIITSPAAAINSF